MHSIMDILRNANCGDTIMIHAPAGMGKSTILCHTAIQWHNGDPMLRRYKYLYLLPVRRITNHTEVLERILTRDLELLPEAFEGKVRRSMKFCSKLCLILIDGFDEMNDVEMEITVLNKLLARKFAKDAVVIISTRPNCIDHILKKTNGNLIDLPLYTLDKNDIKAYVKLMFPENEDKYSLVYNSLLGISAPNDILNIPLFLAILCCLCRDQLLISGNLDDLSNLRNPGSIFATFWSVLLEIKHHKTSGFKVVNTLLKKKMERETRRLLKNVAKLCFDSMEKVRYIFTEQLLENYDLCIDDLTKLGPIDVKTRGQKVAMFVHTSFQEYCAGIHIARNDQALALVLNEWRGGPHESAIFKRYKNAFIYAIGMDEELLSKIPHSLMRLSPLHVHFSEYNPIPSCYIDLSTESLLLQECVDKDCRQAFIFKILEAPVCDLQTVGTIVDINMSCYDALIANISYNSCLDLVKRVYTQRDSENSNLIVFNTLGESEQVIGDPLLLAVLLDVSLSNMKTLWIRNASPTNLRNAKKIEVSSSHSRDN